MTPTDCPPTPTPSTATPQTERPPARMSVLLLGFGTALTLALSCAPPDDLPLPEVELRSLSPVASPELDVDDGTTTCTLEARASALIDVVDQYSRPIDGTHQGLEVQWAVREPTGAWSLVEPGFCVDEDCRTWVLGWELPGEYQVTARACDDEAQVNFEVGMTPDGCHVDTVSARMQLELAQRCLAPDTVQPPASICDPATGPTPSIIALTGIQQDDMILPWMPQSIEVMHGETGRRVEMDCLDPDCTSFVSSHFYVPGEFRVDARMCGERITQSVSVDTDAEGCVETEWIGIFSDAAVCAGVFGGKQAH